jgi:DNA-binding transcriptional regulator YhcF (GntR family)
MDFKTNNAIYLQIADRLCDEILSLKYPEDERIPSVREYAATVEVNFNTVVRSFDHLQAQGVIYTRRGMGYFVAPGARSLILSLRKKHFLTHQINDFFRTIALLEIPMEEIVEMYNNYYNQLKNKAI